uniref:Extracellular solute-binding protein n=1 Tax=Streptomyces avermitilis TaxID=33903 RepID=A0A499V6D3_STRAX|nr:hypothetical protein SAVMC3_24830 [Streptomyces avermitilis]
MSATSNSNWDRRSVLRAAAGLAALGPLAACGSNTGRSGGGSSGESLVQYFHAYGEAGTEQAIRRYAKAYDKAAVTTQWITGTNFESKLFSALLTDNAPDVFEFHPQLQMIKSGQVAALDDIIDPVKDDFNPADITSHTVDGKVYGVRMIDDPQFFFYRKSLLEKAGTGVPRPWTNSPRPPPNSPPTRSRACSSATTWWRRTTPWSGRPAPISSTPRTRSRTTPTRWPRR